MLAQNAASHAAMVTRFELRKAVLPLSNAQAVGDGAPRRPAAQPVPAVRYD